MSQTWQTHSADETRQLGAAIGHAAKPGTVILLYGDLGAGKTTLAQGIGSALGIDEVSSPTFLLAAEHQGRLLLHHVDLYRLEETDDLSTLGLDDLLGIDDLVVVEWPERYLADWPDHLTLHLTGEDDERTITLQANGPRSEALLNAVTHAAGD